VWRSPCAKIAIQPPRSSIDSAKAVLVWLNTHPRRQTDQNAAIRRVLLIVLSHFLSHCLSPAGRCASRRIIGSRGCDTPADRHTLVIRSARADRIGDGTNEKWAQVPDELQS